MIWVTGDCHGDFKRFSTDRFPEGKDATKDDYVIICGDFGLWHDTSEERYWFKWLSDKPWTTLFVDGNHENYDRLNKYPIEVWQGGKIHKITDSIFHLIRGEIFILQDKLFFVFGGARSHDISDGIIDPSEDGWLQKARIWQIQGKLFRINHYSWWKEEMPNEQEMNNGICNLGFVNNNVDYIITHDCPTSIFMHMYRNLKCDINDLNRYLQDIQSSVYYKRWYFGHHHINKSFGKEICLYENIERIV